MNWLSVSERIESCIAATVFKYWTGIVPLYINNIFDPSQIRCNTKSQMTFDIPVRKISTGQVALSFYGLKTWTKVSHSTKSIKTIVSFTHALKEEVVNKLYNSKQSI